MTYSFTPFSQELATPGSLNSRFQEVIDGLNQLDLEISPASLAQIQNSVAEKLVDAAGLMSWLSSIKTDSTSTNDSNMLASAAAVYALAEAISTGLAGKSNTGHTHSIAIADVDDLQSALDNRLHNTVTLLFDGEARDPNATYSLNGSLGGLSGFTDIIIEATLDYGNQSRFKLMTIPFDVLRKSSTVWSYEFSWADDWVYLRFPNNTTFNAGGSSGICITRIWGRW
jgi:hypothetical protein